MPHNSNFFISNWPRLDDSASLFCRQERTVAFDFSHYVHALVTHYVQYLYSDWSNLTGELMRKIYAPSWNLFTLTAEADRVLCPIVLFLTVFFHWMDKMKFSCYQESSVIMLVCLLGFWLSNTSLVGNPISDIIDAHEGWKSDSGLTW